MCQLRENRCEICFKNIKRVNVILYNEKILHSCRICVNRGYGALLALTEIPEVVEDVKTCNTIIEYYMDFVEGEHVSVTDEDNVIAMYDLIFFCKRNWKLIRSDVETKSQMEYVVGLALEIAQENDDKILQNLVAKSRKTLYPMSIQV